MTVELRHGNALIRYLNPRQADLWERAGLVFACEECSGLRLIFHIGYDAELCEVCRVPFRLDHADAPDTCPACEGIVAARRAQWILFERAYGRSVRH